jgi:signal transduction histidine kinase
MQLRGQLAPGDRPGRPRAERRLHLPRYTVRLRLTLLYGGVFLLCGAVLLGITYLLVRQTTRGPDYSVKTAPGGANVQGAFGSIAFTNLQTATSKGRLRPITPAARGRRLIRTVHASPTAGASRIGSGAVQVVAGGSGAGPGTSGAGRAASGVVSGAPANALVITRTPSFAAQPLPALSGPPLTLAQAVAQAHQLQALGAQQHSDELHQLLIDLGIALAITGVVSMGLGWIVAGRALRPLQTITRAARAISATSLNKRLSLRGPRDELRELGTTFDELLERLERSFEAQRQFVANASHELRTPLTLERAILEVTLADPAVSNGALRATCERVLAIGEQQERMIEALLTLARSERGLECQETLDIETLVRDVVLARRAELSRRGLQLESDLDSAATTGDAGLVERLVTNLLDNAIHHNAAGGWVRVSTGTDEGRAAIVVSNSGPVVPPDEVERLFAPFQRMRADRTAHGDGHGLGLSIVSAVAGAHRALLHASARPGGGLDVEVGFAAALDVGAATSRATAAVPQSLRA